MTYMLDQCALVLECVTLAEMIEFVVEVLVDLAGCTVLDEEAAEDTLATHPKHLTVVYRDSSANFPTLAKSPPSMVVD